jgi:hypothetical protein
VLEVQDVNGNLYFWSDRRLYAPSVILAAQAAVAAAGNPAALYTPPLPGYPNTFSPPVAVPSGQQVAWIFGTAQSVTLGAGGPTVSESNSVTQGSFRLSNCNPPLPAGATINALWPTMLAAGSSNAAPGYAMEMICLAGTAGSLGGFASAPQNLAVGQFTPSASIGTSQAALDPYLMGIEITASGPTGTFPGPYASYVGTLAGVPAIAVYYTPPVPGTTAPPAQGDSAPFAVEFVPWLVEVPQFTFHRSLLTDMGAFTLQNLSGDTLSRDFEKIARRSALEGALFIYRLWQADAQAPWLEVHGTLTVDDVGTDTVTLKGRPLLNPSQEDTPLEAYCETCQLQWGGRRCGATGSTECQYSFQTCQVPERIMVALNHFEKNYGETTAATAQNTINRRRAI